ncbi:hypothetical protein [Lysinibacillus sp. RC79]|uniref:hypothetical protein n=1 Tax=Lysinibacillus sp. RC79 TaxID=3156296 RepID=UPI0035137D7D
MKKWVTLSFFLIFLMGCQSIPFGGSQIVIDWVDFIKWNGIEYDGINNGILADKSLIEKELGEVQFKVADNVSNSSYKLKDGDAAFQEKGTKLYSVKGEDDVIAVKDQSAINGYRIYFTRESTEYKWYFDHVPLDQVKKIELYKFFTPEGKKQIAAFVDKTEIDDFLEILSNSKKAPTFEPDTSTRDPISYAIILYTDESIAYKYSLQYDGNTYFWYPSDTAILSGDIQRFILEK